MKETTSPYILFVYGTLLRAFGHPMHQWLAEEARALGAAEVAGRLLDLGRYPGMISIPVDEEDFINPESNTPKFIRGECYRIKTVSFPSVIRELDRYEGCHETPPEYRRIITEARLTQNGEKVLCWVYEYLGSMENTVPVPNGDYLEWRSQQSVHSEETFKKMDDAARSPV